MTLSGDAMPSEEPYPPHRMSVPVPDPTMLTTQQLIREIKALQDIIEAKLAGMDRANASLEILINEKIEAFSKKSDERHVAVRMQFSEMGLRFEQAIAGAMEVAKAARDSLENKTQHVLQLHNEKFSSVNQQFEQNAVALNSTLNATKETFREQQNAAALAIAKSESAMAKQLDQITALMHNAIAGIESKIADMKDRLTGLESRILGQGEQRVETRGSQTNVVGIVGLALGIVVGLGGLFIAFSGRESANERVIIEQPLAGEAMRQQAPLR